MGCCTYILLLGMVCHVGKLLQNVNWAWNVTWLHNDIECNYIILLGVTCSIYNATECGVTCRHVVQLGYNWIYRVSCVNCVVTYNNTGRVFLCIPISFH